MRGFQVGGLALNPRLIAFFIVWILTPRGHNHIVLNKEDLILMYCIINRVEINWAFVIGEQMEQSRRLTNYRFPYVVLVSKLIGHFKIPLEGELVEPVKQSYEVSATNLHKIGLTQINSGQLVCQANAENPGGEAAEAAAKMKQDVVAMDKNASPSSSYSRFEQTMINKLDYLTTEQRNHHEFCTTRFQHINLQIEAIQEQIATITA